MKDKLTLMFIGLISGILGAFLYSLCYKFDSDILKHLIDWPFLGFLLIVLIIITFNKPIREALSKGKLKFKYGDTEISLEQLPDLIDQDIDSKFETIKPDKTELKPENKSSILGLIMEIFNIQSEDLAQIIFHIGSSNYKWRNIEILTKRTSFDQDLIERIVKAFPDIIIRSIGKTGNTIYRLQDKYKLLYEEKIKNIK